MISNHTFIITTLITTLGLLGAYATTSQAQAQPVGSEIPVTIAQTSDPIPEQEMPGMKDGQMDMMAMHQKMMGHEKMSDQEMQKMKTCMNSTAGNADAGMPQQEEHQHEHGNDQN